MRIAIIGAGISGLTAAWHLSEHHELALFEAGSYLGGHTNTVDVECDGRTLAIDTGFIVYNDRTYPNFIRLLDQLQVGTQPTNMSFSVRCDRTGLEYSGNSLNGLFAQRRNLLRPRFYRLLRDFMRFNRRSLELLASDDESLTVGEYLARGRYSREFVEQYFLPMGSAIWSCPRTTFEQFPMRFIVAFYQNHGLLGVTNRPQWRVIRGGSRTYVDAMSRRFAGSVRLNSPVVAVTRGKDFSEVQLISGVVERFDHVVFACHADQALRMLGENATPVERELLSAFPYERNLAVLHTDATVLPRSRRAWAAWNYHLPTSNPHKATVTYNMNILQGLTAAKTFCVTLNNEDATGIDPRQVIRRIEYHHPIYDTRRLSMQRRHAEVIHRNRTSFCGAYLGNGFHEDGVVSALAVCRALVDESWKVASTKVGSDTGDTNRSNTAFATECS